MKADFIIQETHCDAPLRVSRVRRLGDEKAALLYEFSGTPLSAGELSKERANLGAALLSLESASGGVALMVDEIGTPLCALREPLSIDNFLARAVQLTEALAQAHEQSGFYRHLSDATIFVDEKSAHIAAPAVAEFLFAQTLARGEAGDKNAQLWTMRFIAPEQTGRMNRTPDTRADIYALGVAFYQMLTGCLPFESADALELMHSHLAKTPVAPRQINENVPPVLSDIILKLLAKTPRERYQGTFGLLADLHQCQTQIGNFELGRRDVSEHLQVPPRLYGREDEMAVLHQVFERAQSDGEATLLLIGGYSGVGKTALAQALRPAVTQAGGYFLAGKIDQFRRNLPYASIAEAFQNLIRQLQTENETRIAMWRTELQKALGENGQVIADVIPEIELIIGPQPPVAALAPSEAISRFNAVFRAFISVFARPEQSLVLLLDDLQWMDSASLKLMESLMNSARNLLIIGAFRDNEVSASHPLTATAERIEIENQSRVRRLNLLPLLPENVTQLLADTLHNNLDEAGEISRLLVAKTDGNAFFLIQFLQTLQGDGLLHFDRAQGRWNWDAKRIQQAGISGDVVELMAGKIRKLSPAAREILPVAACLGSRFEVDNLALVRDQKRAQTLAALREALDAGLLLPEDDDLQTLRFLHDRVQQAAYSLLTEKEKTALHAHAGQLLAAQAQAAGNSVFEEQLFDIVNHLNNGSAQLISEAARLELSQWNLRAALKAKNALAYESAQRYAAAGIEVLPATAPRKFAFELHFERCENELLIGDLNAMQTRFDELFALADALTEKARAYDLKVLYFATRTMLPEAIEVGLEGLRALGFAVPDKINKGIIVQEIARVKWLQGRRKPDDLLQLPQVREPERLAMLSLLSNVIAVTFFSDANLFAVLILKLTGLSMQIGNSPIAPMGYGCYGIILCSPLGDYKAGYEFGQLAMELSRRSQDKSSFSRATLIFGGFLCAWRAPLVEATTLLREGYEAGAEVGDNLYASFDGLHVVFQRIFHGENLSDINRENDQYLDFSRRASYKEGPEYFGFFRQFIACLQGRTRARGSFADGHYDEAAHEREFNNYVNRLPALYHATLKMEALCLFDEPQAALRYARRVWQHPKKLEPLGSLLFVASFHLYHSLAQAMHYPRATTRQKRAYRFSLEVNLRRFQTWAKNCPQNFAHLEVLVGAELSRVRGDVAAAQTLYEKAIALAEKNGFLSHAALAHNRAGTMNLMRGSQVLAKHHLSAARDGYEIWGASEKVRLLEEKHGALLSATPLFPPLPRGDEREIAPAVSPTPETVSATLDLGTVIKASQAISGEIEWTRLLRVLLNIAIENAGAQRGILLLDSAGELRLAAAGTTSDVEVQPLEGRALNKGDATHLLPLLVVNYVARTRESVVLSDAQSDELFGTDAFVENHAARSILCTPIVHQNRLVGVLYLQNDLAPGAFTENRLRVLTLLAAQAAVSLEAARAYARVRKSENQLQSILDNATTIIYMKDVEGRYMMVNTQFAKLAQLAVENIVGATDFEILPPEMAARMRPKDVEVLAAGVPHQWEENIVVEGVARTYLSVKFPLYDDEGTAYAIGGVSTDITERKRAEQVLADYSRALEDQVAQRTGELRDKNAQLQSTLDQLQDAQERMVLQQNLAYLGTLTTGIAHEIQNPLNFVINFAQISTMLAEDLKTQIEEQKDGIDETAREFLAETISDLEQNSAKINQHGKRIDSIIKSMLLHSRGISPTAAPANLNTLLDESIDLVYHALRADNIDLNIDFQKHYDAALDTEKIEVIAQDLGRVFTNIISNAVYAAQKQKEKRDKEKRGDNFNFMPTITITSRDLGSRVEIRIRDNGGGIAPETRVEIFKPFFTTKPTGEGTGLGLSICYDIVSQEHGGALKVESLTDAEIAEESAVNGAINGAINSAGGFAEFIITLPKTKGNES